LERGSSLLLGVLLHLAGLLRARIIRGPSPIQGCTRQLPWSRGLRGWRRESSCSSFSSARLLIGLVVGDQIDDFKDAAHNSGVRIAVRVA
jgi:hypothetical protein